MTKGVGTALQQGHRHIPGIRRPQNGAYVPRVLDAVQKQAASFRLKVLPFRQGAEKHRPLGRLHRRNGLHDLLAHPDEPHMLRQLRRNAVGKKYRLEPRTIPDCLLQELGAVSHKQPPLLPLPAGGQKLSHLLDQRIFPGCDPLLHHSFCTFSRETLSPSTTRVSPD